MDHRDTHGLSKRELEVLQHLANGKTHAEIGEALAIAERTVLHHVANARTKLDCLTRVQAVAKAVRLGLVE